MNEITDFTDLISEKCRELAQKHTILIENHLLYVCDRYKCTPDDLEITYSGITNIDVSVRASRLVINEFFKLGDK